MANSDPRNASVLAFLGRGAPVPAKIEPWDFAADPYLACGSHPDVVERIWDQLGAALPADCRALVGGSPALVHPRTALVFALAMGTQYALRLPGALRSEAMAGGAKTKILWAGNRPFDLAATFGAQWVFGAWLAQEGRWCRQVFDAEHST